MVVNLYYSSLANEFFARSLKNIRVVLQSIIKEGQRWKDLMNTKKVHGSGMQRKTLTDGTAVLSVRKRFVSIVRHWS